MNVLNQGRYSRMISFAALVITQASCSLGGKAGDDCP
jgi:hypothetical protein